MLKTISSKSAYDSPSIEVVQDVTEGRILSGSVSATGNEDFSVDGDPIIL